MNGPYRHGFQSARPDHLPIAAEVWDVGTRYDLGGETVVRAIYDALVRLETELVELRQRRS